MTIQTPIKSYESNQHNLLESITTLHCPDGIECDVTYGMGGFYKDLPRPRLCFDIQPLTDFVIKADTKSLPVKTQSIKSIVFDPPFLTYIRNGRDHADGQMKLSKRFGGFWHYSDLVAYYEKSLVEIQRVLSKKGILIVKCQDIRYNHILKPTHMFIADVCKAIGLILEDLFVLCRPNTMPFPQRGIQRHARIHHSYMMVFKKTRKRANVGR